MSQHAVYLIVGTFDSDLIKDSGAQNVVEVLSHSDSRQIPLEYIKALIWLTFVPGDGSANDISSHGRSVDTSNQCDQMLELKGSQNVSKSRTNSINSSSYKTTILFQIATKVINLFGLLLYATFLPIKLKKSPNLVTLPPMLMTFRRILWKKFNVAY